jgi:hypothetical protein
MIRIDEIYNHTFWPFIRDNLPLTRMFFCDPPGRSDPDSLYNHGSDTIENNYIFFHDQEPIHLDLHQSLFDEVCRRNLDLRDSKGAIAPIIVTSEKNSDPVAQVCSQRGWHHLYYFFHGWAALDWYRGYDKTFLIAHPRDRDIQHSFISANRIVGGHRGHRLQLMYLLLRHGIQHALISFPSQCPYENHDVLDLATSLIPRYPDARDVFADADLPWEFDGESGHPMHSCWLSLFQENSSSMVHVVTETVFHGQRHHLTEKTFKPICLQIPFVLVSTANSLKYLRSYGFKTFHDFWDESYDQEKDDDRRLEKIADLLMSFDRMTVPERRDLFAATIPVIEHNYQHFYQGGFEDILWTEFQGMLVDLKQHHVHAQSLL